MVKIQKILEIDCTFGFIEFNVIEKYCHSFACSKLGRFHSLCPVCELVRKSYFLAEGKIVLMLYKLFHKKNFTALKINFPCSVFTAFPVILHGLVIPPFLKSG